MDFNQRLAWLKENTVPTTCPHCGVAYGKIIPETLPHEMRMLEKMIRSAPDIYIRGDHCLRCGICGTPVPKETMYHPLGDQPVCKGCYESLKDSDYTFAEDIA